MRLADLCEVITKGTTPTTLGFDFSEDGVAFLRVQNIDGGSVNYERGTLFIDERTHQALARSQIRSGDVLVSIAGTIGRSGIVPENSPALNCNQAVAIVRTNGSVFRPFLRHWLESSDAQTQMRGATVTGTISNLSLTQVGNLQIPLPPLAEQRRIAEVLDQAEALRAKRRCALGQLDTLTQALFLDLLCNPRHADWPRTALRDAYWFQEGPGVRKWQFRTEGIKLLNVGNIEKDGSLNLTKTDRYLAQEEARTKYKHFLIDPGDLVIASSGISFDDDGMLRTRGAFVSEQDLPLCMNTSTIRFKALENVSDLRFLWVWLNSREFRGQITKFVTGSAQQNFGPSHLSSVIITLPPLAVQRDFAGRVAVVEKLKTAHRASLAGMGALFASLQHRAFRGEL